MITICDFDDSFTYNIFSTLKEINSELNIDIVPKERVLNFLQRESSSSDKQVIILGPGPGHPDDYNYLFKAIVNILANQHIFTFGICLGHQLIWRAYGKEVSHCLFPFHGRSRFYKIPHAIASKILIPSQIKVQHYNSLAVKCKNDFESGIDDWKFFSKEDELVLGYRNNGLTYQFHPESIGTSFPQEFFTYMLKFLI